MRATKTICVESVGGKWVLSRSLSQGRYDDAEPLYLKAIKILKKSAGAEHLDVKIVKAHYKYMQDQMQQLSDE